MSVLSVKTLGKSTALVLLNKAKALIPVDVAQYVLQRTHRILLERPPTLAGKKVQPALYRDDAKGGLCVSLDWDLRPDSDRGIVVEATRSFLDILDTYDIPATLAVCGEHTQRFPESLQSVLASNPRHEVASHSFGHLDLSDPSNDREKVMDDLRRNAKVLGTVPRSFIFPWNREGQIDVLKELGFVCYRGGGLDKLGYPSRDVDIWNIAKSYYLANHDVAYAVRMLGALLELAVRYRCLIHVWTHPWNMACEGNVRPFMTSLERFLRHAARMRAEGRLWIATMRQIASYCEATQNTKVRDQTVTGRTIRFSAECRVSSPPFDPPEVTLKVPLPSPSSRLRIFSDGKLTHSFDATWSKYKTAIFTTAFEKPEIEFRVQSA